MKTTLTALLNLALFLSLLVPFSVPAQTSGTSIEKRIEKIKARANEILDLHKKMATLSAGTYANPKWEIKRWLPVSVSVLSYGGDNHDGTFLLTQVGTDDQGHSSVVGAVIRVYRNNEGTIFNFQDNDQKLIDLIELPQ